jgi:carbamoyltransferase
LSLPAFVLGISAFYHDSAVALLRDGDIVAAASEERFTRIKGDPAFPARALEWCLRDVGISTSDLAAVAFYEKPILKLERILETYLGIAPRGFSSFLKAGPVWIKEKLYQDRTLRESLGGWDGPLLYAEHHESHAASAFLASPFEEAAILTIDGVGEWATATIGAGQGNDFRLLRDIRWPDSSACSTRRLRTTPASRSIPASTRSWGSPRTVSRSMWNSCTASSSTCATTAHSP